MQIGDIRISRGIFAAILLMFFFPFITVSCGPQSLSFSGLQLVTGGVVQDQRFNPNLFAVLAFLAIIAGLAVTFIAVRRKLLAMTISGGVGAVCLLLLRGVIASEANQLGPVVITYNSAYWLALLGCIAAAGVHGWLLRQPSIVATPVVPAQELGNHIALPVTLNTPTPPVPVNIGAQTILLHDPEPLETPHTSAQTIILNDPTPPVEDQP